MKRKSLEQLEGSPPATPTVVQKKKDIHQKFQQSSYNDEYVTIILHVSTNDLANDGADEVAERMENLIVDVKKRAKRVGISSVIW